MRTQATTKMTSCVKIITVFYSVAIFSWGYYLPRKISVDLPSIIKCALRVPSFCEKSVDGPPTMEFARSSAEGAVYFSDSSFGCVCIRE